MNRLQALTERYVTVDALVFVLRSVRSSDLAEVGHAYVEGLQAAASASEETRAADLAAELRAVGEDEETIRAAVETMRASATRQAIQMHAMAVSTPEGQAAYEERMHAYVCAAVVGIGRAAQPLVRELPDVPAYELHEVGVVPEVLPLAPGTEATGPDRMRVVDVARPEDGGPSLDDLDARNEMPLWSLPHTALEALGLVAAQLAGGRAATMAPFRALARGVRDAGPAGPALPH